MLLEALKTQKVAPPTDACADGAACRLTRASFGPGAPSLCSPSSCWLGRRAQDHDADAAHLHDPPLLRARSTHLCFPLNSNACHLACAQNMYYQQQTTKLEAMGPMPIDPGPDLVCRMAARSFAQVVCAPHARAVQMLAWVAGCGCEEVRYRTGLRCTALLNMRRATAAVCAQARVMYMKDLKSGKNKGAATMAWMKTLAAAHSNGC
jgi:hypothetical protein